MSSAAEPRFITLEGGEGTGKSTQSRLLADALAARGLPVLRTREPGGAPGAEFLREVLLGGTIGWSAAAETMLHFAARAEHVERTIRPALAAGMWVVCDRFFDSTMAYQGFGLGADRERIAVLTRLIGIRPDLTLVLDANPDLTRQRMLARSGALDRYERLDEAFHDRVQGGFRKIASDNPDRCVTIDASGSIASVQAAILHALDLRFQKPQ
jgi:dTMP kinase